MSTTYKARTGDTWEIVSSRVYGVPTRVKQLQAANPGLRDPFITGDVISVPDYVTPIPTPEAPANIVSTSVAARARQLVTSQTDDVTILVDGKWFNWSDVTITRSMDSVDVCTVSAPFDPSVPQQREIYRPFAYKSAKVQIGGADLFTGSIVSSTPNTVPDGLTVSLAMYSTCGVLGDCTQSVDQDVEFGGVTLDTIARQLLDPFGLSVDFEEINDTGAVFESVSISPGETILTFLSRLASQRGFFVGTDQRGGLVFRKWASAGNAVARLSEGAEPLVSVGVEFNGQQFYSSVTGVDSGGLDEDGGTYTERNTLAGSFRPFVFTSTDATQGDIKAVTQAQSQRMLQDAATWVVNVSTWRDPAGRVWTPNSAVKLTAAGAMVYSETELLIRRVELKRSADSTTARLELILPVGVTPPWL